MSRSRAHTAWALLKHTLCLQGVTCLQLLTAALTRWALEQDRPLSSYTTARLCISKITLQEVLPSWP